MQLNKHASILPYNTFHVDAQVAFLVHIKTIEDAISLSRNFLNNRDYIFLGGGSNILFTRHYDGVVIKVGLKGKELIDETPGQVYIKVQAGEVWDDFVAWSVNRGYGGIENLSLIPGNVGSSPIQNIGAYGVELKDVFHSLEALDLKTGSINTFSKPQCNFGYRSSIFKEQSNEHLMITSVVFKLEKKPVVQTGYGSVNEELEKMGVKQPGIKDMRKAIISIRKQKLPDPNNLGNAGSFFKNPVISIKEYERCKDLLPGIVSYKLPGNKIKLAAGWLIEKAGWKGVRRGNVGVHHKQALVLVNYGNATGKEIFDLSEEIIQDINKKYGIKLKREVNII